MNSEQYETLLNQLSAIEAELRETRKVLELHAPERELAGIEETVSKPSPEDLNFEAEGLDALLGSEAFHALPEAIDRFLGVLGYLHYLHGDSFSKIS